MEERGFEETRVETGRLVLPVVFGLAIREEFIVQELRVAGKRENQAVHPRLRILTIILICIMKLNPSASVIRGRRHSVPIVNAAIIQSRFDNIREKFAEIPLCGASYHEPLSWYPWSDMICVLQLLVSLFYRILGITRASPEADANLSENDGPL